MKEANLATKGDVTDFTKKKTDFDYKIKNLNKKVTSNKSKHLLVQNELKKLQNKIEKLQTYDSSLFIGQRYFFNDGARLYLTFQMLYYTLKRLGDTEKIASCKPKGFFSQKTYLQLLIIVLLHQLNGTAIHIFV